MSTSGKSEKGGLIPAKVLFVGDRRVGTTSLIRRFVDGEYTEHYRPQMTKVARYTHHVYHTRHRCEVTVQFWDVEGADTETAMKCAQKAHAVAVVFDVTNRSSFEAAQRLLDSINPRASSILIGTKTDPMNPRHVSHREGKLLAKIHRVVYIETSAYSNKNVDEAFHYIVDTLPDEYVIDVDPEKKIRSTRANLLRMQERSYSDNVLCRECQCRLHEEDIRPSYRHQTSYPQPPPTYVDEVVTSSNGSHHVVRRKQHYSDSEQLIRKPRAKMGYSHSNHAIGRY